MDISITVTNRDNKIKKIIAPTDMNLNLMEILKVYEYPIEGTCGKHRALQLFLRQG